MVILVALSFTDIKVGDQDVHSFSERVKKSFEVKPGPMDMVDTLSYLILSYMYQPCIPAIYHELKDKNIKNMQWVLAIGTSIASTVYIIVGFFGYVTWDYLTDIKDRYSKDKNILSFPYSKDSVPIKIC